jgi:hypothetical protein
MLCSENVMVSEDGRFGWAGEGLKKLAVLAGIGLIALGAGKLGLAPNPNDIKDPQNWPLWAAVILVFAVYELAWPPLRLVWLRRRVPSAMPGKVSILLAQLYQDNSNGALRETVREAIVGQLGDAVEVILWPESLRVGEGRHAEADANARTQAQKWLRSKSCDLLVWGRAKGDKTLALRFTPSTGSDSDMRSYGLTAETLELPLGFVSDLGAAIAARVIVEAAPAVHMSGHYLVPLMRAAAERLAPIVKKRKPAFDADTRGVLLVSYALVKETIGEQAGSNDDLRQAVAAYREALQERTRERVPLDWAMTQNNLGTALSRLGERESGTARLEEAVAAYREALTVFEPARAEYYIRGTRENLGRAQAMIAERQTKAAP